MTLSDYFPPTSQAYVQVLKHKRIHTYEQEDILGALPSDFYKQCVEAGLCLLHSVPYMSIRANQDSEVAEKLDNGPLFLLKKGHRHRDMHKKKEITFCFALGLCLRFCFHRHKVHCLCLRVRLTCRPDLFLLR